MPDILKPPNGAWGFTAWYVFTLEKKTKNMMDRIILISKKYLWHHIVNFLNFQSQRKMTPSGVRNFDP